MGFTLKFGWTKDSLEDMPIPKYDGFKISREKIWSAKTGRSSKGQHNGDLVVKKVTLDMAFPANLTPSEIKKLMKYANPKNLTNKYCYIQFTNEEGEKETKHFYFGNPSFDAMTFINGKFIWSSIQIQAVER